VYEVFDDVLERLAPTHIVTQIQCEVCAVSLRDVERSIAPRLNPRPRVVALNPVSLADVWDDFRRIGEALAADWRPVVERLQGRMRAIADSATTARPRVACLDWLEPVMPARQWMPELVAMAGGVNVDFANWGQLAAADPDVIVTMPCGFDLARTEREMRWLAAHPEWETLRAVRAGRVHAVDGNQYFNRPGPRLVESLEILADFLRR
jgi:iron complex transport system substrate-binding protein